MLADSRGPSSLDDRAKIGIARKIPKYASCVAFGREPRRAKSIGNDMRGETDEESALDERRDVLSQPTRTDLDAIARRNIAIEFRGKRIKASIGT